MIKDSYEKCEKSAIDFCCCCCNFGYETFDITNLRNRYLKKNDVSR